MQAIRLPKKAGVATEDLVEIYCSLVRSVLEYCRTSLVGSSRLTCLSCRIDSEKGLEDHSDYAEATNVTGLQCLSACRQQACIKFVDQTKNNTPLNNIISNRAEVVCHDYNLASGIAKTLKAQVITNRFCFSNFVTMLYS